MRKITILLGLVLYLLSLPVAASSVWLANGNKTDTGGTLVGFNRDARPGLQSLQWIKPAQGLAYFALFSIDMFDQNQPLVGVNEAGLAIVSLSIVTIPVVERQDMPYNQTLVKQLLNNCRTVDDVLNHSDWLLGPQTIVAADGKQAVMIEIGPAGKYAVQPVENATARHTDQYSQPDMQQYNQKVNKNSNGRYQQLAALLKTQSQWTIDDFVIVSQFTSDDNNASLFRTGNKMGAERTMATWVMSLTVGKSPEVYLMMVDDKLAEENWFLNTSYVFSGQSQFVMSNE